MNLLRFFGAALGAALVVLWADAQAGELFTALGPIFAPWAFSAFSWACMFAATMLATPHRKHWGTAAICGFVLAAALHIGRDAVLLTRPGWHPLYLFWIAVLVAFALPLFLLGRWYTGLVRQLGE